MLKDANACIPQRQRFRAFFDTGGPISSIEADVTLELCLKYALEFSWGWAGMHLLTPERREHFLELRRAITYKANVRLVESDAAFTDRIDSSKQGFLNAFKVRDARIKEIQNGAAVELAEAFFKASQF
jgi:hypothetical protein